MGVGGCVRTEPHPCPSPGAGVGVSSMWRKALQDERNTGLEIHRKIPTCF